MNSAELQREGEYLSVSNLLWKVEFFIHMVFFFLCLREKKQWFFVLTFSCSSVIRMENVIHCLAEWMLWPWGREQDTWSNGLVTFTFIHPAQIPGSNTGSSHHAWWVEVLRTVIQSKPVWSVSSGFLC